MRVLANVTDIRIYDADTHTPARSCICEPLVEHTIVSLVPMPADFDAIWAMMAHSSAIPAGIFKTLHPEVLYVLTLQEGDPPEYIEQKMRPIWPLFVRGFTKADFMQTISTFLARWGRKMGFGGPLEVIPNAVDIKRFSHEYPQSELDVLKSELGKKEGNPQTKLVYEGAEEQFRTQENVYRALALFEQAGGQSPAPSGVCQLLSLAEKHGTNATRKLTQANPGSESESRDQYDRWIVKTQEWAKMVEDLQADFSCT